VRVIAAKAVNRARCAHAGAILLAMQPRSFDEQLMTEWSLWVLDHGLPPLPDRVAFGDSVPIAYWAGPLVGAVSHVQASAADLDLDQSERFDTEIECFRRIAGRWESVNAGGGTNWPPGASLVQVEMAPGQVGFGGELTASGDGPACTAVDGVVGIDARWIETTDHSGTVRRPIEAPLGVIVVAVPADRSVTIRVLDCDNHELGSYTVYGASFD
jgi:hypothetical protein